MSGRNTLAWVEPGSNETILSVRCEVRETGDEIEIGLSGEPVVRTSATAPRYDESFDEAVRRWLLTNSALTRWASASGKPRSAKTLPLPRSTAVSSGSIASAFTVMSLGGAPTRRDVGAPRKGGRAQPIEIMEDIWLWGQNLNLRPSGYESADPTERASRGEREKDDPKTATATGHRRSAASRARR